MPDFPTIVYKCPGDRFGPPHTTYQSIGVTDQKAFDKALTDGWYATLVEAVDAYLKPAPERVAIVSEPAEDAPPTRDEMLTKAAEIGLTVDKRWSDKTLANKIIEALEAQEAAEAAPEPTPEPTPEPAPDPEPQP
jgi:hypothetical protein